MTSMESDPITRSADAPCKPVSSSPAVDSLPSVLPTELQLHEEDGSEASFCSCNEDPSSAEAAAEAALHTSDAPHAGQAADPSSTEAAASEAAEVAEHVQDAPHDGHPSADDSADPPSRTPLNGQELQTGEEQQRQQQEEGQEGVVQQQLQQEQQEALLKRADELKVEGNGLYGQGKFEEAAAKYNEAIATGKRPPGGITEWWLGYRRGNPSCVAIVRPPMLV